MIEKIKFFLEFYNIKSANIHSSKKRITFYNFKNWKRDYKATETSFNIKNSIKIMYKFHSSQIGITEDYYTFYLL